MSLKDVRNSIVTLLGTINTAQGYSMTVDPTHVFATYDTKMIEDQSDSSYPKFFVVTNKGDRIQSIGETEDRDTDFLVVAITKSLSNDVTASILADMVDDMVDDLDRLFNLNDTLGGTVHKVTLNGFTTDSGFTFPEGVVVAYVKVEERQVSIGE